MKRFTSSLPVEIIFGCGVLQKLGDVTKRCGKKVFLCIDPFINRSGIGDEVVSILKKSGDEVVIFSKIKSNPNCHDVDEGADLCKKEKCNVIVGIGGGSTIDTGKAVSILAKNSGCSWDYITREDRPAMPIREKTLPLIAIPTTAGTGSEVTPYSVISNPDVKEKGGIDSRELYPDFALVDPELMVSAPAKLTAYTGIDVLAHSIESFININATPFSEMVAKESIRIVGRFLGEAIANGKNLAAREQMAWASTLGGIAIANACTTLPHALGQAMGGLVDMPHGASLAACLKQVLEVSYKSNLVKFAEIAELFDDSIKSLPLRDRAEKSVVYVDRLLKDCGVNIGYGEYGVTEKDIEKAADMVINLQSSDLNDHPLKVTKQEIIEIYRKCL